MLCEPAAITNKKTDAMKKFTLADYDNYLEGSLYLNLKGIPDCKGKYDIADKDGNIDDWNWLILTLLAKIENYDDIFEDRETENAKYNFIWQIIKSSLSNDETNKEIQQPYKNLYLRAEIFPTFIQYQFEYHDSNDVIHCTKSKSIILAVKDTVMLLESGVFTDIVDNRRYGD